PPPPIPPQDDNSTTQNDGNTPVKEEPIVPIGEFGLSDDFQTNIKLQEHETEVNENYFISLIAGSISLSIDEKKKIIENFGSLNQFQVDELIKIFEEEKGKFSALDIKHKEQLDKLQQQHKIAWEAYEAEQQQKEEVETEEGEAEDIRKSLGL
ncbi:hypothetical protein LR002_01040, partial [Candidatus Gracilibacteria bacterium]|nr:hypothetical protein [Candidatus Gracilibacteria bacterium]